MPEAIENICSELPPGWSMSICFTNGIGRVELEDNEGFQIPVPNSNNKSMTEKIDEALRIAKKGR